MSEQLRPLSELPNEDGFRFIGVNVRGLKVRCKVIQDKDTKVHYVIRIRDNEPFYSKLKGWL
jgi:hypothetical protein